MRIVRALAMLTLVAGGMSGCSNSTATTTSEPAAATSEAPPPTSTTTERQTLRHLLDGSAITVDDANRDLAITHGTRAELRLPDDYTWSDPQIAGPGELVPITPPDDGGYAGWELITSSPGNLIISASGTPNCGDCNLDDLTIAFSIVVRQP